MERRELLAGAARLGGVLLAPAVPAWAGGAPGQIRREGARPGHPSGVQSGDVTADGAVVWGRTDRPARMTVEWSTSESFANRRRVRGPAALDVTDYAGRVVLGGLPAGEPVFYRVFWDDLAQPGERSVPAAGAFRTAPD